MLFIEYPHYLLNIIYQSTPWLWCYTFYKQCPIQWWQSQLCFLVSSQNADAAFTDATLITFFPAYIPRALFDVSFFAIVTTVGLGVIFGIIIDTFSELRDEKVMSMYNCNQLTHAAMCVLTYPHAKYKLNCWSICCAVLSLLMLLIYPREPWSLCTNGIHLQYHYYFHVIMYIWLYLQYKAEADRKDFCFICNIPAHEFDRKSEVSTYWYTYQNKWSLRPINVVAWYIPNLHIFQMYTNELCKDER